MNIVFFGSSQFAVPSLEALITAGHQVCCVVTQPDRAKGRGLHLETTVVKEAALAKGLEIYQPPKVNFPEGVKYLGNFNADLFVVIAYGQILSQEILDIPTVFSINAHASLLPKYRGAAPVNWALINDEAETGISIIKIIKEMDAGPLILQKTAKIYSADDAITLEEKLAQLAARGLIEAIAAIGDNTYALKEQNERQATMAPKLKKDDGLIKWDEPAENIFHLIRGCLGWPGAFTYYKGKLLKIYRAGIEEVSECQSVRVSGKIVSITKEGIVVATGKDNLVIKELQLEGRRIMQSQDFISGHKIMSGEILG